jgi:hypothetical protein
MQGWRDRSRGETLISEDFLPSLKFGLTSAPRWRHAVQTKRGSRSDSRMRSGHWSALTAMLWLH